MTNYYKIFKSPVNKNQLKPLSNLIQSSTSSKIFEKNFAKQIQSSMKEYLSTINESTSKLKEIGEKFLKPENDNSFDQKTVTSDDTENTVEITANKNAEINEYSVNVLNLAKKQSNKGHKFWPNEETSLNFGKRSLTIKTADEEEEININIDENDTNKTVLEKINSTINKKSKNISSSLENDSGKIFLNLKSKESGLKNSFEIQDKNGHLAIITGIKNISNKAEDSKFLINGNEDSSFSNKISIDNDNVVMVFNNKTNKAINFSIDVNKNKIKKNIEKLILSYNNMITTANNNLKNFNGAKMLKSDLAKIINDNSVHLENIGLYTNKDDTLSINYEKLDNSISNNLNSLKKVFSSSKGIASKLSKKGSEIISEPSITAKSANFAKNYEAISIYTTMNNSTPAKYLKGSLFDTTL